MRSLPEYAPDFRLEDKASPFRRWSGAVMSKRNHGQRLQNDGTEYGPRHPPNPKHSSSLQGRWIYRATLKYRYSSACGGPHHLTSGSVTLEKLTCDSPSTPYRGADLQSRKVQNRAGVSMPNRPREPTPAESPVSTSTCRTGVSISRNGPADRLAPAPPAESHLQSYRVVPRSTTHSQLVQSHHLGQKLEPCPCLVQSL